MDPRQFIGDPWVTWIATAVTIAYCGGLGYMSYSIYRITPELLQVRLFGKLRALQNSVLTMGLGLMVWMVLTTLFVADVVMPDVMWLAGVVAAAALLGLGMFQYSQVLSVPRGHAD